MPYLVWREGPDGPLGEGSTTSSPLVGAAWTCRGSTTGPRSRAGWLVVRRCSRPGRRYSQRRSTRSSRMRWVTRSARWLRSGCGRILRMWTTPIVPVMRATVGTPEDILELFARLNRSGIPVRDADIYFAAVKTFWNEAEPRLKRVVDASRRGVGAGDGHAFLDMERALRLISRLAGRGLGGGDVLPLTVERIAGNRREAMVAAMDALTSKDSPVLERLDRFFEEYPTESRLKYGLRYVSHQLWDEVLGWAVTRGHWDDADLQAIDAYLFGGTVFRYATIFGTGFSTTRVRGGARRRRTRRALPATGDPARDPGEVPDPELRATPGGGAAKRHRGEQAGPAVAGGPQRSPAAEYRPGHRRRPRTAAGHRPHLRERSREPDARTWQLADAPP